MNLTRLSLTFSCLSMIASIAHGAFSHSQLVTIQDPACTPSCQQSKAESGIVPAEINHSYSYASYPDNGTMSAFAYGSSTFQKARAEVRINLGRGTPLAYGETSFIDRMVFHSESIPDGAIGQAEVPLPLSWKGPFALSSNESFIWAIAWAKVEYQIGTGARSTYQETVRTTGSGPQLSAQLNGVDVNPLSTLVVTGPVTFGVGIQVRGKLTVYAEAQSAVMGSAFASIAADNSVYWGGISSLTVGDVEITDFTVVSDSGVDYRLSYAPVPEPGAHALMLAGLGLVGYAARRRKRA